MKSSHDSAVKTKATPRVRSAHRSWAALLVVALVASLQVLLPNAAQAHDYGPPGLGGAKITLTFDGYASHGSATGDYPSKVTGKGFKSADLVHIFECQAGEVDLLGRCQPLATAPTDHNGAFGPTDVVWESGFRSRSVPTAPGGAPTAPATRCLGGAPEIQVQCAVVAATFAPGSNPQPTSKAEHFICNAGLSPTSKCQPRPTTSVWANDVSVPEGNAGSATAAFAVSLRAPTASSVNVSYATANGSATAGSDYTATSGTVTIAAGATTATVSVPVNGDTSTEADELFYLDLTNLSDSTALARDRVQATIANDDPASTATLSVNDVTVPAEGEAGTTKQAIFTVSLSKAYATAFTVRAITTEYTAHPLPHESNDYVHLNQVLSFAPGELAKQVAVTINGDNVDERDETFALALEESTGPQRQKRQGLGVITNDDGLPTMSINDVILGEGNTATSEARFTVSLSQPSFREIKVDYATVDGTARSSDHAVFGAADYSAVAGTLIFAPGETTKAVVVAVKGDTLREQDEEFVLNLSNNINATTTKRTGAGIILNDDGLATDDPTVTIHDFKGLEGRYTPYCGQTGYPPCQVTPSEFPFRIELSKASSRPITVSYATADGTARSTNHATFGAADYTPASGSVTFAPGEKEKTVVVLVNPDDVMEPTYLDGVRRLPEPAKGHAFVALHISGAYEEDFFVQLTSAVNANPTQRVATGHIQNDDWIW